MGQMKTDRLSEAENRAAHTYDKTLNNIANGVIMDLTGYIQDEDKAGRIDALIKAVEEKMCHCIADALTPDCGEREYTDSQGKRLGEFYELIFDTIPKKRKARRKEELEYLKNGGTKPRPQEVPTLLKTDGVRFILEEGCKRALLRQINDYQYIWLKSARLYRFFLEQVSKPLGLYKRTFDTDRKSEIDWEGFAEIIENGKDMTPSAKTSGYDPETGEYAIPEGTEIVNAIMNAYRRERLSISGIY